MTRSRDVADTQDNLGGAVPPFTAGKNRIINGDFGVWQRGTSFAPVAGVGIYTADRFVFQRDGSGYTATCSRQTFSPGSAPVAGYEGQFFWRYAVTVAGTSNTFAVLDQRIEDVRTFAGRTVVVSFWAKADTNRNVVVDLVQNFGSGGSSEVGVNMTTVALTTSWQRFTASVLNPSVSGKTIGTSSFVYLRFNMPSGAITPTIDLWGVQLEAGSTASPFQTATGTVQGELAACQRYYWRENLDTFVGGAINGFSTATTTFQLATRNPVAMRVGATAVDFSALRILDTANSAYAITNITLLSSATNKTLSSEVTATISGGTAGRWGVVQGNGSGYLGFSAEL